MTEITTTTTKGKRMATHPRIDLTPMVDLAFLLITFFIFTATLSEPTAMTTLLPANSNDSSSVAQSGAVTLIATKDKLLFYQGDNPSQSTELNYTDLLELRVKLITVKQQLIRNHGNDNKLFVMIKPTNQAAFKHIIHLLDEMKICQVKSYTLADMNITETGLFALM
jgi:biopolymer transport protein ExbD